LLGWKRKGGDSPTIVELSNASVEDALEWFQGLRLQGRDAEIARDIVPEIRERLKFLREVGLGYLQLGRGATTLSGGEAQRIRLAAQLGSNLTGVLYILDEPTIGLHARDNEKLLTALEMLKARGNSLVVVEHDEETMRRADYIIDLGSGRRHSRRKSGGRRHAQRIDGARRLHHGDAFAPPRVIRRAGIGGPSPSQIAKTAPWFFPARRCII
jgi:excinuclease ABC subunit A